MLLFLIFCTIGYAIKMKYADCVDENRTWVIERHPIFKNRVAVIHRYRETPGERAESFSHIFKDHVWGKESAVESNSGVYRRSGPGSTLLAASAATTAVVTIVKKLAKATPRVVIVDVPCGDMTWMNKSLFLLDQLNVPFLYFGFDIVDAVVAQNRRLFSQHKNWHFGRIDLVQEFPFVPVPVDLFLTRQMTQHLYTADALSAFEHIFSHRPPPKFLLATTFPHHNDNQELTGKIYRYRRQNLELPPFSFSAPECIVRDCCDENSIFMGLWNLKP